ncbi:MAG: c-type cytochrome [Candidatus Kapaibacteriales bacterium]
MAKRQLQFEDEIDFKEILKHPSRWFGYAFIFILVVILAVSIIFLNQLDFVEKNTTPYYEPDSGKLFVEIQPKLGSFTEGVKFEDLNTKTDAIISRGEELYKSTCASCHGNEGKGDGLASTGLNPKPRNFTSPEGWKNGRSLLQIYKTLQEGIAGSSMVAYDFLSPKDKISLFYYISSKFFVDTKLPTLQDFAELDSAFKVSEPQVIPTQIPTTLAMQRIYEDNRNNIEISDSIVQVLSSLAQRYSFLSLVDEPSLFASFLVNSRNLIKSPIDLESVILSNIPRNGFSNSFFKLNESQKKIFVNEIYEFLKHQLWLN